MTRVAVIGNAGGGKSAMAQALAAAHGLPYYAIDKLQWRPGWVSVPEDEVSRLSDEIIAQDK